MKKILLAAAVAVAACFGAATPALAQFSPPAPYTTITNGCGTFWLSGGNYYNAAGTNLGSTLPACGGSMSTQNSASVLITGGAISGTTFTLATYTFSTLPTCNTAAKGQAAVITDGAGSPTYNANAAGSGSTVQPVVCNGTNWTNH